MKREEIKKTLLLVLCYCFLSVSFLSGLEESIVLGREDQFQVLDRREGLVLLPGYQGFLDLFLKENEYQYDPFTDLLLHFDGTGDRCGNYTLLSSGVEVTDKTKALGYSSGVFLGKRDTLVLKPSPRAIFSTGNQAGDFTIEFWLSPLSLNEGETVFLVSGKRQAGGVILNQEIRCNIRRQRIEWVFENIFVPFDQSPQTIVLPGKQLLIPGKWNHYALRFDSTTGLLEFLVNGVPENILFVSESGREDGTVMLPYLGAVLPSVMVIGEGYNGFIDEFRLSSTFRQSFNLDRYPVNRGVAVSRIIDLGETDTLLKQILLKSETPGDTAVYCYIRMSNEKTDPLDLKGPWIPVSSRLFLESLHKGRYLQLRLELYPDGTGMVSPRVSELQVVYEKEFPPLPPAAVYAQPGNGSVTLQWRILPDNKAAGYLVYYGDRPGSYFGTEAREGSSPIDAGNSSSITLTGLENGKLYYFTLVSYDSALPRRTSIFSQETSCRPVPW